MKGALIKTKNCPSHSSRGDGAIKFLKSGNRECENFSLDNQLNSFNPAFNRYLLIYIQIFLHNQNQIMGSINKRNLEYSRTVFDEFIKALDTAYDLYSRIKNYEYQVKTEDSDKLEWKKIFGNVKSLEELARSIDKFEFTLNRISIFQDCGSEPEEYLERKLFRSFERGRGGWRETNPDDESFHDAATLHYRQEIEGRSQKSVEKSVALLVEQKECESSQAVAKIVDCLAIDQ